MTWLVQSVQVCHKQDVGSVEKDEFIDSANVVSVHEETIDEVNSDQLVAHCDQTQHTLGQIADTQVLESL